MSFIARYVIYAFCLFVLVVVYQKKMDFSAEVTKTVGEGSTFGVR